MNRDRGGGGVQRFTVTRVDQMTVTPTAVQIVVDAVARRRKRLVVQCQDALQLRLACFRNFDTRPPLPSRRVLVVCQYLAIERFCIGRRQGASSTLCHLRNVLVSVWQAGPSLRAGLCKLLWLYDLWMSFIKLLTEGLPVCGA